MSKKIWYGLVGVIVIAIIAIGIWATTNKKEVSQESVTLNLSQLSTQMDKTGGYDQMAMNDITKTEV